MQVALDTGRCRPTGQLRRPGQDPGRAHAGGRGRRDDRDGVGDRGRARRDDRRASRHPPARRRPRQPGLPGQGLRACGWAAARSSSASTPRRCRRCSSRSAATDLDFLGFHIFAGSQNLNAEILCEAQRKTVELALAARRRSPLPVRYLNLGGGFGIPYFEKDAPLDLDAIGANLGELLDERDPPAPPRRPRRDRARPLHRRRGRRLRHARRRPQGVARQDLPRRRRRAAPPARRLRQLRPGHPPQLPGRDRRPDGRRGDRDGQRRRRLPVHAARPAGRRRRPSPAPTSATSWSSSRPAPTA